MPHDWKKAPFRSHFIWKCRNCGIYEMVRDETDPEPDRVISGNMEHNGTCEEIIVSKISHS